MTVVTLREEAGVRHVLFASPLSTRQQQRTFLRPGTR